MHQFHDDEIDGQSLGQSESDKVSLYGAAAEGGAEVVAAAAGPLGHQAAATGTFPAQSPREKAQNGPILKGYVYRSGGPNPSNWKAKPGQDYSVRDTPSNPWPQRETGPVFPDGKKITEVDAAKLPPGRTSLQVVFRLGEGAQVDST